MSTVIAPALRKGRRAYAPAALDVPRTWTDVRDVARLLRIGARDHRAWGRAWHVPSDDPASVRQLTRIAAEQLGVPARVSSMPYAALWAYGPFNPFGKELRETQHQFRKPFVLDSEPRAADLRVRAAPAGRLGGQRHLGHR